jgi:uncharacterized protein (DUF2141 family)
MKTTIASLALALSSLAAAGTAAAADLRITVENIRGDEGKVLVGLFDKAESFPKEVARGQAVAAAQRDAQGKLVFVFPGIAAGTYAVSAIHDRDDNGKLTTNVMGVPAEPYGFSDKGSTVFGPPTFADVAISLPAEGAAIAISVK